MSFKVDSILETAQALDKVSASFCVAKWKQVTLHLQTGRTHSCHHPQPHKIPLAELKEGVSALHNTEQKKRARQEMLSGIRPAECDFCWAVEDLSGKAVSDRIIKSSQLWARPELETIAQTPFYQNVDPSYLEVSFSHRCNLKCLYCDPATSSAWESEIRKFGSFKTVNGEFNSIATASFVETAPINEAANPYIEAFWEWLPSVYSGLNVLRLTGGEPLLSPHAFRLMEFVQENPREKLELSFNTNLSVSEDIINSFIERLRLMEKSVGRRTIYTSLDAWGPAAEYIRSGLRLRLFEKNLDRVIREAPGVDVTIMCTFSFLSLFSFREFLDWVRKKRTAYPNTNIFLDIAHLRHPQFLSVLLDSGGALKELAPCLEFMTGPSGYSREEILKMRRLMEFALKAKRPFDVNEERSNLLTYLKEIDRRRGSSYEQAIPQLQGYFAKWSMIKDCAASL